MAIVPEAPSLLVHAQGPAVVSIDPAVSAGDVGNMITISVDISNVMNLVGYDVAIQYDSSVLSVTSASFPVQFATNFPVTNACSDTTGSCESANVEVGSTVANLVSPTAVMVINFRVVSAAIVPLTVTKADLAVLIGGMVVANPDGVTTSNGSFEVPPTLTFVLPNATVAPGQRTSRLSRGNTQVTLQSTIIYDATNVRAGFGGVTFDVIDPNGVDTSYQSNIAFFFPGDSATVTATYMFATSGNAIGTYHIIVTMLRCPDPSSCVNGQVVSGLFFKLKA
jgi:hypothetical protein